MAVAGSPHRLLAGTYRKRLWLLVSPLDEAHADQPCFLWFKTELLFATEMLAFYLLYYLKEKVFDRPVGLCIVLAPLLKQAVYQ